MPRGQYREMDLEPNDATVSLGLPADPASIAVVRAVVASVASRLALPYDAVDDLRIAVAETAALLLQQGATPTRLRVDLFPGVDELRLTVWVEGVVPSPQAGTRGSLAWRVIEGLTDKAVETIVGDSPAIELHMRTVAR